MSIKRGVSLYSYQKEYFNGRVTLENMIALVANSAQATGIQLLPEQMPIGRYPHAYDRDVAWWKEQMERYGTTPVCLDSTFSTAVYRGRIATAEEQRQIIEDELNYAAKFGFHTIRYPVANIHRQIVEESLPLAEEYGVSFGMEIHVPMKMDTPLVEKYLDMIERTGTKFASIIPDLAIYSCGVNAIQADNALREGARQIVIDEISSAYREGADPEKILKIVGQDALPSEVAFAKAAARGTNDDPEKLRPFVKYISNVHGKCYWLDENCEETGINTAGVVRVLLEEGYDGYICTEYEGVKASMPQYADEIDEIEQVRRHHVMLRRLLGEA